MNDRHFAFLQQRKNEFVATEFDNVNGEEKNPRFCGSIRFICHFILQLFRVFWITVASNIIRKFILLWHKRRMVVLHRLLRDVETFGNYSSCKLKRRFQKEFLLRFFPQHVQKSPF